MRQIIKILVLQIKIPVPVSAPADIYSHSLSNASDIPAEMIKPVKVIPVNRVGDNINSPARQRIMFAMRKMQSSPSLFKSIFLVFFVPGTAKNRTLRPLSFTSHPPSSHFSLFHFSISVFLAKLYQLLNLRGYIAEQSVWFWAS